MILKLRGISYETCLRECLATLQTSILKDQIEMFKILNGYENMTRNIFSQLRKIQGLDDVKLH